MFCFVFSNQTTGCLVLRMKLKVSIIAFSQWSMYCMYILYQTLGLGLNLYLYCHDRKSFRNWHRMSIVSVLKRTGFDIHIHNWPLCVSLYSFPAHAYPVSQNDNRLLSQSPKPSFRQRLLDGENNSPCSPSPRGAHAHAPLLDSGWNNWILNYLINQFARNDENASLFTFSPIRGGL